MFLKNENSPSHTTRCFSSLWPYFWGIFKWQTLPRIDHFENEYINFDIFPRKSEKFRLARFVINCNFFFSRNMYFIMLCYYLSLIESLLMNLGTIPKFIHFLIAEINKKTSQKFTARSLLIKFMFFPRKISQFLCVSPCF